MNVKISHPAGCNGWMPVPPAKQFLISLTFYLALGSAFAHAVVIAIQGNGGGGALRLPQHESLSITVTLQTGGMTNAADWWLAAETPDGTWYSYNAASGAWHSGLHVAYQGPLMDVSTQAVLSVSNLALGSYTFYFGVDFTVNGQVDSSLVYDTLTIHIVERESLPDLYVDIYDAGKAWNGLTLFSDAHDGQHPRIAAVNMQGDVVWQYELPEEYRQYTNPGFDVEYLPSSGHVLMVLPAYGVIEINTAGNVVWQHLDSKISHDADRLSNGNTLYVFGNEDQIDDAQVKEVNTSGELAWSWYAKNEYNIPPYNSISNGGWTHVNGASRLSNGNTLISIRNFNLTIEVDPQGTTVWSYDWSALGGTDCDPHDPELGTNGHLLVCLQKTSPCQVAELDRASSNIVWTYSRAGLRTTRDGNRLPNGNTLIVSVLDANDQSVMFEVTPDGEIVWQLKVKDVPATSSPGWFYKAQRISNQSTGVRPDWTVALSASPGHPFRGRSMR